MSSTGISTNPVLFMLHLGFRESALHSIIVQLRCAFILIGAHFSVNANSRDYHGAIVIVAYQMR